MSKTHTDVWHSIILGAGASGLFCAGSYPAKKLVLEHNDRSGKKLSVTGGGKCNFTNLSITAKDYVSQQKHFCKSALAAFRAQHFTQLLEQAKISFYEKENGQLFAHNAQNIVRFLEERARKNNTIFSYNTQILGVTKKNDIFQIQTSKGTFYAQHLIVATGGLSYPALGAGRFAFQVAQNFHIPVTTLRPALVGLKVPALDQALCKQLAGNSLVATATTQKHTEKGVLLFTHDRLSGPVILQTSLFHQEADKISVNFAPEINVETVLKENKNSNQLFSKILSSYIPSKITKLWLGSLDKIAAEATKQQLRLAAQRLNNYEFIPTSTAGYTRAEVTAGGIDCASICASSMECKTIPNLFFIGEALDVTGRLGGYNLHWAWASAYLCAERLKK